MLEVLLALTIFALVSVGVLMTFRTAARSYERSERIMEALQTTRAVVDVLSRDIRAAFLISETNYGVTLPANERTDRQLGITSATQQALDNLKLQYQIQGIPIPPDDELLELLTVDNFGDPGLQISLHFTVDDGSEFDSISFVRRLRSMRTRRAQPWGLARLTYEVEEGRLVRRVEPMFQNLTPLIVEEGEELTEASAAWLTQWEETREVTTEVLTDGVEAFELRCVFWAEDEWRVCENWDSRERRRRNSLADSPVEPGDPNYAALVQVRENLPEDGLPAAVEILLTRTETAGRVRPTRLVVPLFGSQETWTPPDPRFFEVSGGSLGGLVR